MTADERIRLVQVIVAALAILGALLAVGQKLRSDNRAEWYRRYAQATEWSLWQEFEAKTIGWLNLPEPGDSALVTHTEVPLVRALALDRVKRRKRTSST
ncbi:hypothetical protein ACTXMA_05710 [Corynebacterium variabile]|uniref:hypothetical protein n=1 Tax=Corynebacterium variabile TaxID=1727 RepID=UPI003FD5B4BA